MPPSVQEQLQAEIARTEELIADYRANTEPIEPDNAIGRISRMDAIVGNSLMEGSLQQALARLDKLKRLLAACRAWATAVFISHGAHLFRPFLASDHHQARRNGRKTSTPVGANPIGVPSPTGCLKSPTRPNSVAARAAERRFRSAGCSSCRRVPAASTALAEEPAAGDARHPRGLAIRRAFIARSRPAALASRDASKWQADGFRKRRRA